MTLNEIAKFVDFTSLNPVDNMGSITEFIQIAKLLESEGNHPAGICLHLNFANLLAEKLSESKMKSIVVAGSFPHGQSPIEIKKKEVLWANEYGVDEIDIVINRGLLLEERFDDLKFELDEMRKMASSSKLKVILETCEIHNELTLRKTCQIALDTGADFLKTSTGKGTKGADPISFGIIAEEIVSFYHKTGTKVGLKAAGGIKNLEKANNYIEIVNNVLGDDWLTPEYFRIGASSLLNDLIR